MVFHARRTRKSETFHPPPSGSAHSGQCDNVPGTEQPRRLGEEVAQHGLAGQNERLSSARPTASVRLCHVRHAQHRQAPLVAVEVDEPSGLLPLEFRFSPLGDVQRPTVGRCVSGLTQDTACPQPLLCTMRC